MDTNQYFADVQQAIEGMSDEQFDALMQKVMSKRKVSTFEGLYQRLLEACASYEESYFEHVSGISIRGHVAPVSIKVENNRRDDDYAEKSVEVEIDDLVFPFIVRRATITEALEAAIDHVEHFRGCLEGKNEAFYCARHYYGEKIIPFDFRRAEIWKERNPLTGFYAFKTQGEAKFYLRNDYFPTTDELREWENYQK